MSVMLVNTHCDLFNRFHVSARYLTARTPTPAAPRPAPTAHTRTSRAPAFDAVEELVVAGPAA